MTYTVKKKGALRNQKRIWARAHGRNLPWFREKKVSYETCSWWMVKMVSYPRFSTKPLSEKGQKVSYEGFGTDPLEEDVEKVSYHRFSAKPFMNDAQKVSCKWFRIKPSKLYSSAERTLGVNEPFSSWGSVDKVDLDELRSTLERYLSPALPSKATFRLLEF